LDSWIEDSHDSWIAGLIVDCRIEDSRIGDSRVRGFQDEGLGIDDLAENPADAVDGFPRFVRFQAGKHPD
jgi:hypothetical protein